MPMGLAVMNLSEIADLKDRDGKRHSAAKVLVFGCTVAGFVTLLVAFAKGYVWTWPAVAAFVAFLWAPYALDVIKALAKIRWGARPPAP